VNLGVGAFLELSDIDASAKTVDHDLILQKTENAEESIDERLSAPDWAVSLRKT
jgi:hypothetical protein